MTRKDLETINNDRIVIDLRMQAEDLINNMESMSNDDYQREAQRIENEIDNRIEFLFKQMDK